MSQPDPRIKELEDRLDRLVRTQVGFQTEVSYIRAELSKLRAAARPMVTDKSGSQPSLPHVPLSEPSLAEPPVPPKMSPPQRPPDIDVLRPAPHQPQRPVTAPTFGATYEPPPEREKSRFEEKVSGYFSQYADNARANLEKFIGENLISKIGIVILILGIGIFAKYAIDNNWISPLIRIVLGYIGGIALVAFAIKLKPKYHDFSAVLISGGMAIMYFITYFAYSSYQLMPQAAAFVLMAMFTIITVASALLYDRQVIAHIGLVGAYGVPFLLSNNSGNYPFLFGYMSVLNAGILAISIKKVWKPIFYTASVFTWLIFVGWIGTKYQPEEHLYLALITLGVFFAIFFATKIVHGIVHPPEDDREDIISTVVTAGIFYLFAFRIGSEMKGDFSYAVYFSYLAAFAIAILATSMLITRVRSMAKTRRPLFYTVSAFTWIIFADWMANRYRPDRDLYFALIGLGVFFTIFYATKIVHRLVDLPDDNKEDIISTVVTTGVFYLFAFAIRDGLKGGPAYAIFFSFLGFFALAILVTSYRYYGRVLAFVAYPFTWLIFGVWFANEYSADQYFTLAAIFASVFFAIFYGSTLIYRVLTEDIGMEESTGILLTNSFIFYGFGYKILDSRESLRHLEGLFTAAHGILHSLTAQIVSRFKPNAVDVVQTLAVLIITFTTIAVPVQFDGNYVTLIWSVEAATLFFFGRARAVRLFEWLSYPVMALAAASMTIDWINVYADRSLVNPAVPMPFANGGLITGLVFVAACGFIHFINRTEKENSVMDADQIRMFGYGAAGVGLFALYNAFRMEFGNYFHLLAVTNGAHPDLVRFDIIAQLNYTMLFLIVMAVVNLRKVRSIMTGGVNLALLVLALVFAATVGMMTLYELRVSYLGGNAFGLFGLPGMNVVARYITFVFVVGALVSVFEYARDDLFNKSSTAAWRALAFDGLLYPCLLVLSSCELMNVAAHLRVQDADKFGISILWGVFALTVIVIGIAKAKKHLRIGAFVLLGATLIKLFFYDATDLPTIPKTILFVSLGLLMLGISFLYNKFRNVIFASVGADVEAEE